MDEISKLVAYSKGQSPQKQALKQLAQMQANVPFKEMPDLDKKVGIVINESITDDEILSVVIALSYLQHSANVKHDMVCKQRKIKQKLNLSVGISAPFDLVQKGLGQLISSVLTCPFEIGNIEGADYTQVLDKATIYNLAKPSRRSFAQVAAMLIGSESQAICDLKPYVQAQGLQRRFDNLVTIVSGAALSEPYIHEFRKFIASHSFEIEIITDKDYLLPTYKDKVDQVINSQLVIGPPSFYTTAAACLEIPVIEVFKSRDDLAVFSKWSSFRYAALLEEEIDNFKASRLEKAWLHWQGIDVNRQALDLPSDG